MNVWPVGDIIWISGGAIGVVLLIIVLVFVLRNVIRFSATEVATAVINCINP